VRSLSYGASLVCDCDVRTIRRAPNNYKTASNNVTAEVHRFQESIAGRSYLIEVAPVADDRWRAYIVRLPGMPTSLMPFYGTTPAEAAQLLCDWLVRAHRRASASTGSV
jgi:IS1 family transposase